MSSSQQGILLPPGKAGEASQVTLPSLEPSADASKTYAHLFENATSTIHVADLRINPHLPSEDRFILLHASSSSSAETENRLASEVLLDNDSASSSIKGKAYLLYAEPGKNLTLKKDWEALHDVCYGARLANVGKATGEAPLSSNLAELAKQFIAKREQAYSSYDSKNTNKEVKMEEEEAWTDEEVEKPREPKKEVESDDDDNMEGQANEEGEDDEDEDEEEDDDSEGSYEDESELESDGEDDPRKKALLEMIQAAILKDGKLDLER